MVSTEQLAMSEDILRWGHELVEMDAIGTDVGRGWDAAKHSTMHMTFLHSKHQLCLY